MPQIKQTIFREYDIRGQVKPQEITPANVELIGRAFAVYLQKRQLPKKVVLGYDYRSYSLALKEGVKKGLLKSGCHIVDIGLCLTPMLFFAQHYFHIPAGVMITASHNPNGWSGVKLSQTDSYLVGPEIQEIYHIIQKQGFISEDGCASEKDITQAHAQAIVERIGQLERKFKVVVECGNGTAGKFVPAILRQIGCQVIELFCDLDYNFPHHIPNPEDARVKEVLAQKVLTEKADVGISFDGDGDRLGIIDNTGQNIWSDRLLVLLAHQLLAHKPGAKIVFDVKCSQVLSEEILKHKGIPVMTRTGRSYVQRKMLQEQADLGGERSGHIFIKQNWYGSDDAIMASAKLLQYLSHQKQSLAEINHSIPQYVNSPTISISCADEKKHDIVSSIVTEFKQEYQGSVIDIDGARVQFENGWGLIRVSNTGPKISLNFEALTDSDLNKIKNIFFEKIIKHNLEIKEI